MFELAYCSIAKPDISASDIEEILKTSQSFNKENNITGCLVYHNHEFVQILEGEESIVRELYSRIEKDNRHRNVTLLSTSSTNERIFTTWSMAYHEIDADDSIKKQFAKDLISFSELTNKPTHTIRLFWTLTKNLLQ